MFTLSCAIQVFKCIYTYVLHNGLYITLLNKLTSNQIQFHGVANMELTLGWSRISGSNCLSFMAQRNHFYDADSYCMLNIKRIRYNNITCRQCSETYNRRNNNITCRQYSETYNRRNNNITCRQCSETYNRRNNNITCRQCSETYNRRN